MMLDAVQDVLGYRFSDVTLLRTALTHRSFRRPDQTHSHDNSTPKNHAPKNYERLEFLGDRVLGLVLSHWLYQHFEASDQGALTKRFHTHARQDMLASICVKLGLEQHIRHEATTDFLSALASIQSDVMEAVIAAIYLDGGLAAAEAFIKRHWQINQEVQDDNPKSTLQEWIAAQKLPLPLYTLVARTGSDHAPHFLVQLEVNGFAPQEGKGLSRKLAERHAALGFLDKHVHKFTKTR